MGGTTADEGIQDVIRKKFPGMVSALDINFSENLIDVKQSKAYAISTRYVTTVFHGTIHGDPDLAKDFLGLGDPWYPPDSTTFATRSVTLAHNLRRTVSSFKRASSESALDEQASRPPVYSMLEMSSW